MSNMFNGRLEHLQHHNRFLFTIRITNRQSVKSGMENRETEWGEWWKRGESGWERWESGQECGEWGKECWECGVCEECVWGSGWECGESGWECRELGWFFVRIFTFIASAKILECEGEYFTIQLLWAAFRLLVTRFLLCLPSGWVVVQDVGSVQDFIFLYLCLVLISRIRTQEDFNFPLCNLSGGELLLRQSHI